MISPAEFDAVGYMFFILFLFGFIVILLIIDEPLSQWLLRRRERFDSLRQKGE